MSQTVNTLIIGGGASGLLCAAELGKSSNSVLLLEHNDRLGKKILISGGGRCNFTNLHTKSENFISQNKHFCKSALSQYTCHNFLNFLEKHKVKHFEKKLGQLFCKNKAADLLLALQKECKQNQVKIELNAKIKKINKSLSGSFQVFYNETVILCKNLIIATGGLSIPKIGASDFGYRVAKQFGLKVTPLFPALDGFQLKTNSFSPEPLAGVSHLVEITCQSGISFLENILFTHKGLSGPASLQASLHWNPNEKIRINFFPEEKNILPWLLNEKLKNKSKTVKNILSKKLPEKLARLFCSLHSLQHKNIAEVNKTTLNSLSETLTNYEVTPLSTIGYNKAEVTKGGVDTAELSSKSMESKKNPGLYFIGEVVDVTGWLGGFNFQWAWSSAIAAARHIRDKESL